jgi:hypothetical protein
VSDTTILLSGAFCFALTVIGVVMTVYEFKLKGKVRAER